MVKRLLIPVDGSELSARAMTEGIALARQLRVGITGFVVEPPFVGTPTGAMLQENRRVAADLHKARTTERAQGILDRFATQAREAGIEFDGQFVEANDVDAAIVQAAEHNGCDMIVMATHRRGVIDNLLSHSHTKSVIAKSLVPVVVIP
jgi:nucleotide-binding universal stress UspA family protein